MIYYMSVPVLIHLCMYFLILLCIQQVEFFRYICHTYVCTEIYFCFAFLTIFSSYDNYTIGSNRTVYGSGSTILQYFHSLNILRVNSIYITRETIDDIKRFVISESLYATNFYLYAGTGVTTCFHNVYTGDFTLQRFGGVSGGTFG